VPAKKAQSARGCSEESFFNNIWIVKIEFALLLDVVVMLLYAGF
jgi:hypothetical protein